MVGKLDDGVTVGKAEEGVEDAGVAGTDDEEDDGADEVGLTETEEDGVSVPAVIVARTGIAVGGNVPLNVLLPT